MKKEMLGKTITIDGEAYWSHIKTRSKPYKGKGEGVYDVVLKLDDDGVKTARDLGLCVKNNETGEGLKNNTPKKGKDPHGDYIHLKSTLFQPTVCDVTGKPFTVDEIPSTIGNGSKVSVSGKLYESRRGDTEEPCLGLGLNRLQILQLKEYTPMPDRSDEFAVDLGGVDPDDDGSDVFDE